MLILKPLLLFSVRCVFLKCLIIWLLKVETISMKSRKPEGKMKKSKSESNYPGPSSNGPGNWYPGLTWRATSLCWTSAAATEKLRLRSRLTLNPALCWALTVQRKWYSLPKTGFLPMPIPTCHFLRRTREICHLTGPLMLFFPMRPFIGCLTTGPFWRGFIAP